MTMIDKAGRLVVPKAIRDAAHLHPGTQVRFRLTGGCVQIEPEPLEVKLERRGSVVVAVPTGETPAPLTASEVATVIDEIRTRQDRERPGD
ncbi:MAG: AbrB/MazE/SpoVT family DNA-binding domain-containing protein [Holophagales bacterium]|nr:antitoxin [Acidobacteriota bacterium]MXX76737.1 AbrB/MazE/SpoVT family DNA-binding domain-containing protein [Holophagales bacterium]MYF94819.1 AbrB/MazE/SpoVT family DNA-binding domain-containing protein [Holophagales bacterium]